MRALVSMPLQDRESSAMIAIMVFALGSEFNAVLARP